jgi:NAD(P)-dependent dehydrogenase (short-subunit alcohol dehydrogenase family)
VNGSTSVRASVVTGANTGMGRVIAEELARLGDTVVLVCRSRERGEAAQADIRSATQNDAVELVVADLASQRQVREAAAEITERHDRLNVLVNNAGVFLAERAETEEQIEKTFATNYLGHFLLTELLLDALKAGAPARIVNVASRTGGYKIDLDDLMLKKKKYSAIPAASQSKLAQVMFTLELAQRLEGTGVTVNALHPGLVKSGITRELPLFIRTMLNLVSTTPEKGARTALYLATSPDVENVSGQFIGPKRKPLKLAAQANEPEARQRLWDLSVEMTALRQAL